MILYIDTTERDFFEIALLDATKVVTQKKVSSQRKSSELLLSTIESTLTECGIGKKDISRVAVVHGPGSFTALRIGVTTANGLAFGLGVPIVGLDKNTDFSTIASSFLNLKKENILFVVPQYDKQPYIT